jgi:hypothetical protein
MPSLSLLARIASATGKHLILGFEAAEKKAG